MLAVQGTPEGLYGRRPAAAADAVRIGGVHTSTVVSRDYVYFCRNVATASQIGELVDGEVLA